MDEFAQPEERGVRIGVINQPRDYSLNDQPVAVRVTPDSAISISTVFACVRVLAEGVASLPLKLYRRADGGKSVARDHALFSVLHSAANSEMSAFEWREATMMHLALWGNAFSEIEMNGRADVLGLWPLRPDCITVIRNPKDELEYIYDLPGGGRVNLPAYRVMHVRGLGSNGVMGLSPITTLRRTMSLTAVAEQFGNAFYANGARPGGVLQHPGKLSNEAYERLRTSWEDRHKGLEKTNRVAILEEGMQWQDASMPLTDAQFLETRKFQRAEIAGIYRVPPHMIGDLERATFSNIEHQSTDFVVNTLRPWLVRIEQRIALDLIGTIERNTLFAEFLVDGLLRGDTLSRYQAYAIGRQWGWLSPNDIRERENLNPIDGGDEYLSPLNMQPLGKSDSSDGANSDSGARMLLPVVRSTVERIIKREAQDINGKRERLEARGQSDKFGEWLTSWCNEHRTWLTEQFTPIAEAAAQVFGRDAEWVRGMVAALADARVERCAQGVAPNVDELGNDVDGVMRRLM